MVVSLSRRYAKAPAELGSLAVGTNGKCLPAWLMRHVLQDKMIAKVGGDARLAAYSTVCADKKDSLFEIICSPRKLSGPQGDKAARFGNGASVHVHLYRIWFTTRNRQKQDRGFGNRQL